MLKFIIACFSAAALLFAPLGCDIPAEQSSEQSSSPSKEASSTPQTQEEPAAQTPSLKESYEESYEQPDPATSSENGEDQLDSITPSEAAMNRFYIYVNDQRLTVVPSNNSSSDALLEALVNGDITVEAHDYGNFEKVGSLPQSFPTNDEQIITEPGDVILYQGNQITIYYDTNSWNFTRLGKVEDLSAQELRDILGEGDVELRLSLE